MEETDTTNMDVDKDTANGKVVLFHTDINFYNGIVTDVYNDDVLYLTDLFPN